MKNKPTVLLPGRFTIDEVDILRNKAYKVVDIYEHQLRELYRTKNPDGMNNEDFDKFSLMHGLSDTSGAWAYLPWNKTLLHSLPPNDLYLLRTNRNKNLITDEEQQKLANTTVGIAGMSVGAGIALALAHSGISTSIKIADFDTLDTSNLNRLRESILSVGESKVDLVARHIYELDPYLNVWEFSKGLDEHNISSFFKEPTLSIVIDEIDDFKMKVKLRLEAKKYHVPLLMFTSLGDNILIDVERYDLDLDLLPFHGLIGDISEEILRKDLLTIEDIKKYSVQVVGSEYIPNRALESVMEMGKTLVGRPQLYGTIAVDGGIATYVVRQLVLNNQFVSGRYFVKFADLLNLASTDFTETTERQELIKKLRG